MQVQVLGSGSDGNCYQISDGQTSLLLECGIPFKEIQRKLNYNLDFNSCLISHSHKDHCKSVKDLLLYGVDVYTSTETIAEMGIKSFNLHTIESGKQFKIGTLIIVPFDLVHLHTNGLECKNFGYLIFSTVTKHKLLFATDTAYIRNRFKGLTHIMVEVNYIDEISNDEQIAEVEKRRYMSHQSLKTALDFLKTTDLNNVDTIYAIHLSKEKCNRNIVLKELQKKTGKHIVVC